MKIKCCPKCGGTIVVSYLYQTAHDYVLTKRGKLSKRFTRSPEGQMDAAIAGCRDCGTNWEVGDFGIDADGTFDDFKYTEEEE